MLVLTVTRMTHKSVSDFCVAKLGSWVNVGLGNDAISTNGLTFTRDKQWLLRLM